MIELLSNIIGVSAMGATHIYSWHCFENEKINFKSVKLYFTLILSTVLLFTNALMTEKFLKISCVTIILILLNYFLLRKEIKKTILMVVITQLMIMAAETVFMFLIAVLNVDIDTVVETNISGGFLFNFAISIIVVLVNFTGIFKKIYQFVLKQTEKISSESFIAFSFVLMLIANFMAMTVYYKIDFKYLLLFNTTVTIIYFIIIIHSFTNRNNYLKVSDKYNTTLSSLKEYEDILNKYRVSNHENKNQLLTIRNMIKNNDKNIPEYIDKLVENKLKDNETLMGQSMIIPEGGLRGLVYSKMLVMKEKKIDFDLSVDRAIRTVELIQLGEQCMLDICKIIGVFLDNAIEAVENLEEKFIDLEMYEENKRLYISITNNFEGNIDFDHIEEKGISTKGEGHGYGLSLVEEIVESNRFLKHEKQINHDEFTQRLIVNISKIK